MNNDTKNNVIASLAFDAKIDNESATRVVDWLISEGVLDFPVVNETYNEEKPGY